MIDLDGRIFQLLFGRGSGVLTAIMLVFTFLGSGWSMLAIAPFFPFRETRRFAVWLTSTLVVTAVAVFAIKAIVMRGRPFTVFHGVRAIALDSPTDYSFPSGHAAGSFCFALFLTRILCDRTPRARYAVPISALVILFAATVGVSRIVLGFHFPLDVLAGAILGGTLGASAGVAYRQRGD